MIDREAPDARAAVGALLTESAALGRLVEVAAPLRFERPSHHDPADREGDTSRRARGGIEDPTAGIVLDVRRLRLSAALDDADLALKDAARTTRAARLRLEHTLAAAHGAEVLGNAA